MRRLSPPVAGDGSAVRLITRGCSDWTGRCPWIVEAALKIRRRRRAALSAALAREEKTQHFPRRVRPSRIGVGAGGTAA